MKHNNAGSSKGEESQKSSTSRPARSKEKEISTTSNPKETTANDAISDSEKTEPSATEAPTENTTTTETGEEASDSSSPNAIADSETTETDQNAAEAPDDAEETETDALSQNPEAIPDTKKKSKAPSNKKATINRMLSLREEFRKQKISFSQANIIKAIGGSYTTVGNLMRELEALEAEPFNLEVVISDAAIAALKLDIQRHVELYRDSINDKLEKIESAKSTMEDAVSTIKNLQDTITKMLDQ